MDSETLPRAYGRLSTGAVGKFDAPWSPVSVSPGRGNFHQEKPPPMSPLALTDEQLSAVMTAAAPLAPDQREPFLIAVAERLRAVPIGDGSIHRVVRDTQREFFDPADFTQNPRAARSERRRRP